MRHLLTWMLTLMLLAGVVYAEETLMLTQLDFSTGLYITNGDQLFEKLENTSAPLLPEGYRIAAVFSVGNPTDHSVTIEPSCYVDAVNTYTWDECTILPGETADFVLGDQVSPYGSHMIMYLIDNQCVAGNAYTMDQPTNDAPVLTVGNIVYTNAEVQQYVTNYLNYMANMEYQQYGLVLTDVNSPSAINAAQDDVIDMLIEEAAVLQKIDEYGIALTDSELEEIDIELDSYWEFYLLIGGTVPADLSEAEIEEYKAQVIANYFGTNRDAMISEATQTKLQSKVTEDIAVTSDEIAAEYAKRVEEDKSKFESNPNAYGTAVNNGATVYYRPAGYRMVKNLLIQMDNTDPDTFAKIDIKADEALAALAAGTPWDEVMAQYTDDPGMQGDQFTAKTGYAVCEGYTDFNTDFVAVAMAIPEVGQWSGKIVSEQYGIFIIQYVGDVEEGPVALDAVKDDLTASLLADKKDTAYEKAVQQWIEEAEAVINKGYLNDEMAEIWVPFDQWLKIEYTSPNAGDTDNEVTLTDQVAVIRDRLTNADFAHALVDQNNDEGIRIEAAYQSADASEDEIKNQVLSLISKPVVLEFRDPRGNVLFGGEHIDTVYPNYDQNAANPAIRYYVSLSLDKEGAELFRQATTQFLGQNLSIWLDETQLVNATVQSVVPDGKVQITGNYTKEDVAAIASRIRYSKSPLPLIASDITILPVYPENHTLYIAN